MKKNILEKLALILSVILFLVPKYIAPVCEPKEDGSHMSCYFSGNMVMKLAGAIFIITLLMIILSKVKIVKILGSIAVIVISAYVYLIPHGMSGLHNEMGKALYPFYRIQMVFPFHYEVLTFHEVLNIHMQI